MYDYELEKSLEERQAEELELNLERNKRNREFDRTSRIAYILVVVVFVISIVYAFAMVKNIKNCLIIASSISLAILFIVRKCPHCEKSLGAISSSGSSCGFLGFLGTKRCPHCGISLCPSESLTAIEKRREREKSGEKSDSD